MSEHTYSTVLYDLTWSDIGGAIDTLDVTITVTSI